jgi:hypothetical protein
MEVDIATIEVRAASGTPGALEYGIGMRSADDSHGRRGLSMPAEAVHADRNVGSGNAHETATYVVDKGKPLVVPADERTEVS